jgi:hypothetical protein
MLPECPVQLAQLRRSFDAAGCRLIDVNVSVASFVGVLLDMQGDGCEANGSSLPPADALEGQEGIRVVGEGLVLWRAES